MSARPALLVVADVAGYTRFMELHATSFVHSHDIVSRLLETAEPFFRRVEAATAPLAVEIEDLGPTPTWYVDLAAVEPAADPAAKLGHGARLARHPRLTWRSLPYLVGRKRACEGFRDVGRSTAAAQGRIRNQPSPAL